MATSNPKSFIKTHIDDPMLRENRGMTFMICTAFACISILSVYLLQRAFTDIAAVGPHLLFWSIERQISIMGLQFSYVTMTLFWPILLAMLCFFCRTMIARKLIVLSFLTSEWNSTGADPAIFSADSIIGGELLQPFPRYVWYVTALMPLSVIVMHLIAGLFEMALLQRWPMEDYHQEIWPRRWAIAAVIGLVMSSVFCLWSSSRLFGSMIELKKALVTGSLSYRQRVPSQNNPTSPPATMGFDSPYEQARQTAWDVFISAKKLEPDGLLARDSVIAEDLYEFLQKRGYQVFFSSRSLELLGASAYKAAIDQALDRCSVLIAVGASGDNLDSRWVKYEWDSFINDVLSGIKPKGRVFVYVEGISMIKLPRSLRQAQAFEHGKEGMEKLSSFIRNALLGGGSK